MISRFIARNPGFVVRHPRLAYDAIKAMRQYHKANPSCAVTGLLRDPRSGRVTEVHHIIPVHVRPDLAAYAGNFVTLTGLMHFVMHGFNWKTYVVNVTETIQTLRKAIGLSRVAGGKTRD
jgi:hypothetical protein